MRASVPARSARGRLGVVLLVRRGSVAPVRVGLWRVSDCALDVLVGLFFRHACWYAGGMKTTCECGAAIPVSEGRGRPARYCSRACQQRAYRARRSAGVFPAEMRGRDRWMRYRLVPRGAKVTKEPTQINGRRASSTASHTWATFAEARASKVGAGLGYALGDGVGCVDLDGALVGGVVQPWARAVLDRAPETFVEVSQSGNGLHIFGYLSEGPGRNRRLSLTEGIEFYSTGRFMAVTGQRFGESPARLADLGGLVAALA